VNRIQLAVACCALAAGCTPGSADLAATTAAATGPAVLATDAAFYTYATSVVVTWTGLNGNTTDWIALAPEGSPLTTTARWAYVGTPAGTADGTLSFEGPVPGGSYVARAFDNNTFTLMGESDPFTIADVSDTHATLALDHGDYAIDQPIAMTWTGMPPNALDWVGIAPVGAPDNVVAVWFYTDGKDASNITFPQGMSFASQQGFPGGDYVARIFLNDTYTKVAETAPVLIGSRVFTDAASYEAGGPITVSWTHLPGYAAGAPEDWVGLSPVGAPADVVTRWLFSGGAIDGNQSFLDGLIGAGTYVARTYAPNTYFISGQSAPFTIGALPVVTLTTDQASYTLGQNVTVTWSGLSTHDHDWIAIAPQGSPETEVTRWIYTHSAAAGSFVLEGPPAAGTYVARAFLNDRYLKIGESAAFPVN
jgi:hypothetical protein